MNTQKNESIVQAVKNQQQKKYLLTIKKDMIIVELHSLKLRNQGYNVNNKKKL